MATETKYAPSHWFSNVLGLFGSTNTALDSTSVLRNTVQEQPAPAIPDLKFNEELLEDHDPHLLNLQDEIVWLPIRESDGTFVPPLWNIRLQSSSYLTWCSRREQGWTHFPFKMAQPIAQYYRRHKLGEENVPEFDDFIKAVQERQRLSRKAGGINYLDNYLRSNK